MSKLTAKARHNLAPGKFALPGERYPVEDPGHAKAAKARASEFLHGSQKAKVDAAANAELRRSGSKGPLKAASGKARIPAGSALDGKTLQSMKKSLEF